MCDVNVITDRNRGRRWFFYCNSNPPWGKWCSGKIDCKLILLKNCRLHGCWSIVYWCCSWNDLKKCVLLYDEHHHITYKMMIHSSTVLLPVYLKIWCKHHVKLRMLSSSRESHAVQLRTIHLTRYQSFYLQVLHIIKFGMRCNHSGTSYTWFSDTEW